MKIKSMNKKEKDILKKKSNKLLLKILTTIDNHKLRDIILKKIYLKLLKFTKKWIPNKLKNFQSSTV